MATNQKDYTNRRTRNAILRKTQSLIKRRQVTTQQLMDETGIPRATCGSLVTTNPKWKRKWITAKTAQILDVWLECYGGNSSDTSEQQLKLPLDKPTLSDYRSHETRILSLEHEIFKKDEEIRTLKDAAARRDEGNAAIRDIRANLLRDQPEPANELELLRHENQQLRELLRVYL